MASGASFGGVKAGNAFIMINAIDNTQKGIQSAIGSMKRLALQLREVGRTMVFRSGIAIGGIGVALREGSYLYAMISNDNLGSVIAFLSKFGCCSIRARNF